MTRFVSAIGSTSWGNISTQYYQSNYNGNDSNITNPKQVNSAFFSGVAQRLTVAG